MSKVACWLQILAKSLISALNFWKVWILCISNKQMRTSTCHYWWKRDEDLNIIWTNCIFCSIFHSWLGNPSTENTATRHFSITSRYLLTILRKIHPQHTWTYCLLYCSMCVARYISLFLTWLIRTERKKNSWLRRS